LTKISVFLYAKSYPSPHRLYANVSAVDLQEVFDKQLAPLIHKIQYYILANHPTLTLKYLLNLETDPWLFTACWPLSKWLLFWFIPKCQQIHTSDWEEIEALIEKAERLAANNKYLCGTELSAADISLAAHCQGLFYWLSYPDKIPHEIFKKIQILKERPIGLLVENILKNYPIKERKTQKLAFGRSLRKMNSTVISLAIIFLLLALTIFLKVFN
jgi:hypothetical protein